MTSVETERRPRWEADARHIAHCDPTRVLGWLDRIEALEREVDALRAELAEARGRDALEDALRRAQIGGG